MPSKGATLAAWIVVLICLQALPRLAVASDGDLDPRFGTGGKVTTDFASSFDNASAVALQRDGKIVVAGTVVSTPAIGIADFIVTRYNADGSLDPTFGNGGKVQTDIDGSYDAAFAVAIQDDGRILVTGRAATNQGEDDDFAVVRYNPDGSLDPTFGIGGKVTTDFGSTFLEQGAAIVVQRDGQIVVAGATFSDATGIDLAIARYNVDGSLDPTFGSGGKVITNVSRNGGDDGALALALQPDGKIVAAGAATAVGIAGSNFAVVRYNVDGSLDATFGAGGIDSLDAGSPYESAHALALQLDGRIVIAGEINRGSRPDFAILRLNVDGSPDTTFGLGGITVTSFGTNAQAFGVGIQGDGKIVAAGSISGSAVPGTGDFGLARYNVDGSIDATFGAGGVVVTDFTASRDSVSGMVLQPDGAILVVGTTASDIALARYLGPVPHALKFYPHGADTPGTFNGLTMNDNPAYLEIIPIDAGQQTLWFSDPALTGTIPAGATVRLQMPCLYGVNMPKIVTLASVGGDSGTDVQVLGQGTQDVIVCLEAQTISIAIPIATPVTLTNRRLALTIAERDGEAMAVPIGLQTFLEVTGFVGVP